MYQSLLEVDISIFFAQYLYYELIVQLSYSNRLNSLKESHNALIYPKVFRLLQHYVLSYSFIHTY